MRKIFYFIVSCFIFSLFLKSAESVVVPDKDADGNIVQKIYPLQGNDGLKLRGQGLNATAAALSTTNIDYQLTEDRYLAKVEIILSNQNTNDTISMQIVAADGTTVVEQFGSNWNVKTDTQSQGLVTIPYGVLLQSGVILRMQYTSTGAVPVTVKINYLMHKKP